MKLSVHLLCLSLSLSTCAFAQGQPNFIRGSVSLEGKYVMLTPGTTFEGRIDRTIGSSVSHNGESFSVALSAPVLLNGTDVVIPAGSEVMGEVVEAVPSSRLPHHKDQPVPDGILRIQLTGLKTAEGATFPLVAALTYDHDRGSGIALVGTPESFAPKKKQSGGSSAGSPSGGAPSGGSPANQRNSDRTRAQAIPWRNLGDNAADLDYNRNVGENNFQPRQQQNNDDPNNAYDNSNNQGGNLYNGSRNVSDRTRAGAYAVGRHGEDPYGVNQSGNGPGANKGNKKSSGIESLVRRNHDLFIDGGSPLTMKLSAALKIGFNPPAAPASQAMPFGQSSPGDMAQPQLIPQAGGAQAAPANNNVQGSSKPTDSPALAPMSATPSSLTPSPVPMSATPAPATAIPGLGAESSSSSSSSSSKSSFESSSHSSTTVVPIQQAPDSQF